jgi:hypothetical protein
MNKFRQWYLTYSNEITWFIIGVCTFSGFISMIAGNYTGGAINFGIAYLNYILNKR